jgi:large subunit ribosomal protein L24
MHIKKGQTVIILTGKDKGKSGEVLRAMPKQDKVIVAGRNMMKKHQKPRRSNEKGTIVEREMPLHVSNVRLAEATPKPKAEPKAKVAKVAKAKTAKK